MGIRRSSKRSGMIQRKVIRTTYANPSDWVAANNANYDKVNVRAKAEEFLNYWESEAFAVYERHGLPTVHRCWRASPDAEWRPDEERPTDFRSDCESFTMSYLLGGQAYGDDSEVGFASAILKSAFTTRLRLEDADDLAVWRAFVDAATLAQHFDCLHLEFGLAPIVGPGRLQAMGRRDGGLARAAGARLAAEERHKAWRDADAKLPRHLSQRARAKLVAKRMSGGPFEAAEATIRRVLPKSGA